MHISKPAILIITAVMLFVAGSWMILVFVIGIANSIWWAIPVSLIGLVELGPMVAYWWHSLRVYQSTPELRHLRRKLMSSFAEILATSDEYAAIEEDSRVRLIVTRQRTMMMRAYVVVVGEVDAESTHSPTSENSFHFVAATGYMFHELLELQVNKGAVFGEVRERQGVTLIEPLKINPLKRAWLRYRRPGAFAYASMSELQEIEELLDSATPFVIDEDD